jgi:HNH endonuclease
VSREEIIAAIQKCAEELGHVPSMDEAVRIIGISKYMIRRDFGPYVKALAACGLERHGCGYKIDMHKLFLDWAEVTRKLGKTPSMLDYEMHGKYTTKALVRNYGGWTHVPAGLLGYAREAQLENDWQDVMEIAEAALKVAQPPARTLVKRNLTPGRRVTANQPVYGPPMTIAGPLVYAPTNEAGVMVLFGAVAREQGFAITRVQAAFPDCEAMREIEPEKWQPQKLEFEYESRNFLLHLHPVDGCDGIVCWKHNWPECPLEVLELSTMTWHRPKA